MLIPSAFQITTATTLSKMILFQLLLLSGDIETNPGPAREKKPDPKKIMEDKVNSHDEKIAVLEKLVKDQKKMLKAMTEKQVELQTALEDSKVEFDKSLEVFHSRGPFNSQGPYLTYGKLPSPSLPRPSLS